MSLFYFPISFLTAFDVYTICLLSEVVVSLNFLLCLCLFEICSVHTSILEPC